MKALGVGTAGLLATVTVVACTTMTPIPTPPTACVDAASGYNGTLVAFRVETLQLERNFPVVLSDTRLASMSPATPADMCWIDAPISKGPPPPIAGTPPPSFDRAMIVSVAGVIDLVEAGYRDALPLPSPAFGG